MRPHAAAFLSAALSLPNCAFGGQGVITAPPARPLGAPAAAVSGGSRPSLEFLREFNLLLAGAGNAMPRGALAAPGPSRTLAVRPLVSYLEAHIAPERASEEQRLAQETLLRILSYPRHSLPAITEALRSGDSDEFGQAASGSEGLGSRVQKASPRDRLALRAAIARLRRRFYPDEDASHASLPDLEARLRLFFNQERSAPAESYRTPDQAPGFQALKPNDRLLSLIEGSAGSVAEFAARAGMSFSQVYALLQDPESMRKARPSTRARLAKALGVAQDDLFPPPSRDEIQATARELDRKGVLSPGQRLKALREAQGWSWQIFAARTKRLGAPVSLSQLARYERKQKEPEALRKALWPSKQALASALGIAVRELVPLRAREELLALLPRGQAGGMMRSAMEIQGMGLEELASRSGASVSALRRYGDEPGLLERADGSIQARIAAALGLEKEDLAPAKIPESRAHLDARVGSLVDSAEYQSLPLSGRLRRLRAILRWTQKGLAKRSGVRLKRIQVLEEQPRSWRSATAQELWLLARALHLPFEVVLPPVRLRTPLRPMKGPLPTLQALDQPQTAAAATKFLRNLARRTSIPYSRIALYVREPSRLHNAPMKDALRLSAALGVDVETLCAPGLIFPGQKSMLPRTEPVDLGTQGPAFRVLAGTMLQEDPDLRPFARLFDTGRFKDFVVRLPIPAFQDGDPRSSDLPRFKGFNQEAAIMDLAGAVIEAKTAGPDAWELTTRGVQPVRIFYPVIALGPTAQFSRRAPEAQPAKSEAASRPRLSPPADASRAYIFAGHPAIRVSFQQFLARSLSDDEEAMNSPDNLTMNLYILFGQLPEHYRKLLEKIGVEFHFNDDHRHRGYTRYLRRRIDLDAGMWTMFNEFGGFYGARRTAFSILKDEVRHYLAAHLGFDSGPQWRQAARAELRRKNKDKDRLMKWERDYNAYGRDRKQALAKYPERWRPNELLIDILEIRDSLREAQSAADSPEREAQIERRLLAAFPDAYPLALRFEQAVMEHAR